MPVAVELLAPPVGAADSLAVAEASPLSVAEAVASSVAEAASEEAGGASEEAPPAPAQRTLAAWAALARSAASVQEVVRQVTRVGLEASLARFSVVQAQAVSSTVQPMAVIPSTTHLAWEC